MTERRGDEARMRTGQVGGHRAVLSDDLSGQGIDGVELTLRRLAGHKLDRLPPGQTLQSTALVNEAWLRLSSRSPVQVRLSG